MHSSYNSKKSCAYFSLRDAKTRNITDKNAFDRFQGWIENSVKYQIELCV